MTSFKDFLTERDPSGRIPAQHLQPGHVTRGTGHTVVGVSRGVRTPSGKVDVTLQKDGKRHTATWGASTLIGVHPEKVKP